MDDLSRWDRVVVAVRSWWYYRWHRYCWRCDVIHRPWNRSHRNHGCINSRDLRGEELETVRLIREAARRMLNTMDGGDAR